MTDLDSLLEQVRRCRLCEPELPLGARPVLQCGAGARILIAGQAPGSKVHASGIPFDDASGERLRQWLGVGREQFYDPACFTILPMGFCYPGTGKSGDLPPRAECAASWRQPLLERLPQVELTLLLGQYAQAWHLEDGNVTLTERVKHWRAHWPKMLPLPHPSPRNNRWLKNNPWFSAEVLPQLQDRVKKLLQPQGDSER